MMIYGIDYKCRVDLEININKGIKLVFYFPTNQIRIITLLKHFPFLKYPQTEHLYQARLQFATLFDETLPGSDAVSN